jgi:hypothetical protein
LLTAANGLSLGGPVPIELARLTDFEEMLVSRAHPILQVYTLFPSGQLGYVGHIANLRQRSLSWVQELPLPPEEVPIILVRRKTREAAGVRKRRAPFAARRWCLEEACDWLLVNNPEYGPDAHGGVTKSQANLDRYSNEGGEVEVPFAEVDAPDEVDVSRQLFDARLDNPSFRFAAALRGLLARLAPPEEADARPWDAFRRRLAEATGQGRFRAAASVAGVRIAWFLGLHGLLQLRPDGAAEAAEDEEVLRAELLAEMELFGENDPVVDSGTLEVEGPQEDEMVRAAAVDEIADALGIAPDAEPAELGPAEGRGSHRGGIWNLESGMGVGEGQSPRRHLESGIWNGGEGYPQPCRQVGTFALGTLTDVIGMGEGWRG